MNTVGKLIIVIGSTGSGKGTLIDYVKGLHPELLMATSCTTRTPRPGEVDGDQYHFISDVEFKRRIQEGDFLEWAQYGDHLYGSLKSEILPKLAEGHHVLDELDVQGVRQIKGLLPPEQFVSIFIDAGSWDELERRIRARAPISDAEIAMRKKRYEDELSFKPEATYVVQNPAGKLDEAKKQIADIMSSL